MEIEGGRADGGGPVGTVGACRLYLSYPTPVIRTGVRRVLEVVSRSESGGSANTLFKV